MPKVIGAPSDSSRFKLGNPHTHAQDPMRGAIGETSEKQRKCVRCSMLPWYKGGGGHFGLAGDSKSCPIQSTVPNQGVNVILSDLFATSKLVRKMSRIMSTILG